MLKCQALDVVGGGVNVKGKAGSAGSDCHSIGGGGEGEG